MTTKVSDVMQVTGSESVGLVPVGTPVVTFRTTVPDANWVFCYGQTLTRAGGYTALSDAIAAGAASFTVPDLRGRAVFGRDNMGGTPANRLTSGVSGVDGTTLGAVGGDQRLHAHNHTATVNDPTHAHSLPNYNNANSGPQLEDANTSGTPQGGSTSFEATGITVDIGNTGAGNAQNIPPAIVVNWIMRAK